MNESSLNEWTNERNERILLNERTDPPWTNRSRNLLQESFSDPPSTDPSRIVQESLRNPTGMWQEFCLKNRSRKGLQKSLKNRPRIVNKILRKSLKNRARTLQESDKKPAARIVQETAFKNRLRNLLQGSSFNRPFRNPSKIAQDTFKNRSRTLQVCDKKPASRIVQETAFRNRSRNLLQDSFNDPPSTDPSKIRSRITQETRRNPPGMWQELCSKNRSRKSLQKSPSHRWGIVQESLRNRDQESWTRIVQESLRNPSGMWQEFCLKNRSRKGLQKSLKNRSRSVQESFKIRQGKERDIC